MFEYDASRMIVFSVALPVAAQITQASHSESYLARKLDLDPHKIAELVLKVFPRGLPLVQERRAVDVTPLEESIVNAALRHAHAAMFVLGAAVLLLLFIGIHNA
jgi:AraC-type transcriptional regulator N-terminus